jgi:5-methylcytosine-specific restriction endonuclease McrA
MMTFDLALSRELDAIVALLDCECLPFGSRRAYRERKAHLEWVAFDGGTDRPDPELWERLRIACLRRDKFTCQGCTERKKRLQAHHIVPRHRGGPDDLENLITLCTKCHKRIHPWLEEWE